MTNTQPPTPATSTVDTEIPDIVALVRTSWPAERWRSCRVLVGCSGGADSVALAVALAKIRQSDSGRESDSGRVYRDDASSGQRPVGLMTLVHVNHNLRGDASDADEECASELARRLRVVFQSVRLDGQAFDEATLRTRREAVFSELAHSTGARYVAVGHTADDNAETILHHLFRGSGPAGIAGIAPFRSLGADAVLVRPLLAIRRAAVRQWLMQLGIPWREDASNDDVRYTRNWIRHELLPLLESRYLGATGRIAGAGVLQREWRGIVERLAVEWLDAYQLTTNTRGFTLRQGSDAESCVVIEAVQQSWRRLAWPRAAMTSRHWQHAAHTITSTEPACYTLPAKIHVIADGAEVSFSR